MDPNLDAIAFLYLTVAHTADGGITGDEMRTLANGVRALSPDAPLEAIGELLRKTVDDYKRNPEHGARIAAAERHAAALAKSLSAETKAQVVAGMREIADADGVVSADESALIERIEALFAR
jgi:uncharacterized tellurite resistance protein B-like protein